MTDKTSNCTRRNANFKMSLNSWTSHMGSPVTWVSSWELVIRYRIFPLCVTCYNLASLCCGWKSLPADSSVKPRCLQPKQSVECFWRQAGNNLDPYICLDCLGNTDHPVEFWKSIWMAIYFSSLLTKSEGNTSWFYLRQGLELSILPLINVIGSLYFDWFNSLVVENDLRTQQAD